ncbi:hypothetical protein [Sandaracinus amylolyticus]|uniref:hypothetical protein n=1 Tax=Sandaracinus amylolyticus TaxID=927083 RepID=UPI001F171D66|nr:hypothetical protein [Sandaracinus amylolyticus]UJR82440.1 Hypothetical protein I5071_45050 [Sandaracinus amylolyticus]
MSALRAAALLAILAIATAASAQDIVERATRAEREGDPIAARDAWRAVLDERAGSRIAARARTRLAWIEARAEGDYAPLAALWRFQNLALDARTREVVIEFATATDGMPAGPVRREARVVVGEDLLRVGEIARAQASFEALLGDADATEPERAAARDGIARAMARTGDRRAAITYLERSGLEGGSTHASLARAELERRTTPIAVAIIALFGVITIGLGAHTLRRAGAGVLRATYSPARMLGALWIALGPVALATRYDDEATDTFLALATGTLVVVALAALAAAGVTQTRARIGLATLAVAAELAVAWLVLLRSGGLISFVGESM